MAFSISSSNDGQPQLDLNLESELNKGLLQALHTYNPFSKLEIYLPDQAFSLNF